MTGCLYEGATVVGGLPKFTMTISDGDYTSHEIPAVGADPNYIAIAFMSPGITSSDVTSQYIFHANVTESLSNGGSTISSFDTESLVGETTDFQNDNYPIISSMPLMLGNKLKKESFRDANGNTLKEIEYTYLYYGRRAIDPSDAYRKFTPMQAERYKSYGLNTGCAYLLSKEERDYLSYPDKFLRTATTYEYSGIPSASDQGESLHHFATKEVTTNSDGKIQVKRYKFPLDYKQELSSSFSTDNFEIAVSGIKGLIDRWMIQNPIEEISLVVNGTQALVRTGKLKTFQNLNFPQRNVTQICPALVYNYESPADQAYTTSFFSSITKNGGTWKLNFNNSYVPKLYFDAYDSYANLLQYHATDNLPTAYLWGYNNSQPIAQVENTTYVQLQSVLGQSVIDNLGINPGTDDQVRSSLQPLRQHPSLQKARVSTYTYLPLFGITSMSDSNNQIMFYEYDDMGRLRFIKDHNSMILKKYVYNYKN